MVKVIFYLFTQNIFLKDYIDKIYFFSKIAMDGEDVDHLLINNKSK